MMTPARTLLLGAGVLAALPSLAQLQNYYAADNITGQLALSATVNLSHAASQVMSATMQVGSTTEKLPKIPPKLLHPNLRNRLALSASALSPMMQSMTVSPTTGSFGFNGLTHLDQREANSGNQWSVEPPSPVVAAGNGFVLEGVNNAVQVYNSSGVALLSKPVSTNQMFGLAPAIVWSTGIAGPFPTDIRVFFDSGMGRWIVLQRAQDEDTAGNYLNSSHLYMAVSQTGDPTGTYNIYTMNTTNSSNWGCPCFPDYPQIGADQYGIYISINEFTTYYNYFIDVNIMAISKASLAGNAPVPTVAKFTVAAWNDYAFTIQPATTPPGASYYVANGGLEYLVSSNGNYSSDSNVAVWAISNTLSLTTASPSLLMTQTLVPCLSYVYPDVATQRPGPLPYGSTTIPPSPLAYLDGGDTRILSLSYAGGRLFTTLATQVVDVNERTLVGGAWMILSPTFRSNTVAASVVRQGYLMVSNNHLLRPAVSVNSQARGAIVFSLVGPDYYPSAAFVPINLSSTDSVIQIAGTGVAPEDGFTGYTSPGYKGVARWGDYSTATAGADGNIWMGAEYIPNAPRTLPNGNLAPNWGTYLIRYVP